MLNSIRQKDRSYEEMIEEAVSQIPIYSKEWSNYNPSDPGITIMQNLTAFQVLQQNYLNAVTDEVKLKLLKLAGYEPVKNRCARVLLQADGIKEPLTLPAHSKLTAGDCLFETGKTIRLHGGGIAAAYTKDGKDYKDITYLLDRNIPVSTPVFGNEPEPGRALYVLLDSLPEENPLVLYAKSDVKFRRNSFDENSPLTFARVKWQYYTKNGFIDAESSDTTSGFLVSGEIRLTLRSEEAAVFSETPIKGYALRCILLDEEYDIPPRLNTLSAFLFEAYERDTKAAGFLYDKAPWIEVSSRLLEQGYIQVFCREEADAPYYRYEESNDKLVNNGRYYTCTKLEQGRYRFEFHEESYSYSPSAVKDAVLIVCYDENTAYHSYLGPIYGYDDQLLDINLNGSQIEREHFSLLLESENRSGEKVYTIVRPDEKDENKLGYRLLAKEGQILITRPVLLNNAKLYLCHCALTSGEDGNIREDNLFYMTQWENEKPVHNGITFINSMPGTGGCPDETLEQLRRRFIAGMKQTHTAALACDYEEIVRKAPGLCIHKVKAVMNRESNVVDVVVKPHASHRFPMLSKVYQKQLEALLEGKRLLTCTVRLHQPVYVPIYVQGTIYVKSHFTDARQKIEELLQQELDYIESDRQFGETVRFNQLYGKLMELECVEYIHDLKITPQNHNGAIMKDSDIHLGYDCLCYLGKMNLTINHKIII